MQGAQKRRDEEGVGEEDVRVEAWDGGCFMAAHLLARALAPYALEATPVTSAIAALRPRGLNIPAAHHLVRHGRLGRYPTESCELHDGRRCLRFAIHRLWTALPTAVAVAAVAIATVAIAIVAVASAASAAAAAVAAVAIVAVTIAIAIAIASTIVNVASTASAAAAVAAAAVAAATAAAAEAERLLQQLSSLTNAGHIEPEQLAHAAQARLPVGLLQSPRLEHLEPGKTDGVLGVLLAEDAVELLQR